MLTQFDFPGVHITFLCGPNGQQRVEITQEDQQINQSVREFEKAFNSRKVDAEMLRRLHLENKRRRPDLYA